MLNFCVKKLNVGTKSIDLKLQILSFKSVAEKELNLTLKNVQHTYSTSTKQLSLFFKKKKFYKIKHEIVDNFTCRCVRIKLFKHQFK